MCLQAWQDLFYIWRPEEKGEIPGDVSVLRNRLSVNAAQPDPELLALPEAPLPRCDYRCVIITSSCKYILKLQSLIFHSLYLEVNFID